MVSFCGCSRNKKYTGWAVTGGSKENLRYSSLKQIDTGNVNKLEIAWIYHSENNDSTAFGVMECNPIIIDSTLYGVSPKLKLFAINAATGKEKWKFDPSDSVANKRWHRESVNMNRGVAYWTDGNDQRIIYTVGPVVFEVNALTGKLVTSCGKEGGIDLREGLDRDPKDLFVVPTSPVMIYKNLFFVSGLTGENTPGHIRAFDIITGQQKWIFHTVPYPGEPGYETWNDTSAYRRMGSTNSWAGFSLDEKRGILYAPTGNPTNDFYGGDRLGNGLFGNCLLALDAETGKLLWHFQTVHHDVWDMDVPAPPSLITLNHDGKKVDAAVQTTKTGLVFVFDRVTGEPVFPVQEKPVPVKDAVLGEHLSPTQPFPVLPKPFSRQILTENDLNKLVGDSSYQDIKRRFNSYRYEGMFTPPTEKGTLIFPGYDGGGEWGGGAIDPETNILYVNANNMAWVLNLVKKTSSEKSVMTNLQAGKLLYSTFCMSCHGPKLQGGGDYPPLTGADKKYTFAKFNELLSTGRRMMPGFNQLTKEERAALGSFILNMDTEKE
jgi:quinoprotein glucose dehydrogenase